MSFSKTPPFSAVFLVGSLITGRDQRIGCAGDSWNFIRQRNHQPLITKPLGRQQKVIYQYASNEGRDTLK